MVQAGGMNYGVVGRNGDRFNMSSVQSDFSHYPPEILDQVATSVTDDLLDDAILNLVFEIHRSIKRGYFFLDKGTPEEENLFTQVNVEGLDVFGQPPVKKQLECICPNCSRNLAAARFAPHLEKCMGMGRNSSRIASRRIQNSTRENNTNTQMVGPSTEVGSEDDQNDEDWFSDRNKKRKRDKNSPRRMKPLKICGVVSEGTGKPCSRSVRCGQHSNEQRRTVREQMNLQAGNGSSGLLGANRNLQNKFMENVRSVDQSVVEMESSSSQLPSSWDHDSNTNSPADSTSTNNSSNSNSNSSSNRHKKSAPKSKKKSSKKGRENSGAHLTYIVE